MRRGIQEAAEKQRSRWTQTQPGREQRRTCSCVNIVRPFSFQLFLTSCFPGHYRLRLQWYDFTVRLFNSIRLLQKYRL